jgi:hypothetical protein
MDAHILPRTPLSTTGVEELASVRVWELPGSVTPEFGAGAVREQTTASTLLLAFERKDKALARLDEQAHLGLGHSLNRRDRSNGQRNDVAPGPSETSSTLLPAIYLQAKVFRRTGRCGAIWPRTRPQARRLRNRSQRN